MSDSATEPLLRPITKEQRLLLEIIGDLADGSGRWPIYQYVQAKMDDHDLDIDAVLGSMPTISGLQLSYSLVRRHGSAGDAASVGLTVAGLAHLKRFAPVVSLFLSVLDRLAEERAKAYFDPHNVVTVDIPVDRLILDLDMSAARSGLNVLELVGSEPATWNNQVLSDGSQTIVRLSPSVRRFRGVATVEDYLARVRAWIAPPVPEAPPAPASPLSLVAAFDYLNAIWRIAFGANLVVVPSAERVARLAFGVDTAEEFDNRLSALSEMSKALNVQGDQKDGSLKRLAKFLPQHLSPEAMTRVEHAIAILQAATHVRNAGQHVGAVDDAVKALPSLGLTFPVVNHQAAWDTVQAKVIAALDTLREEVAAIESGKTK